MDNGVCIIIGGEMGAVGVLLCLGWEEWGVPLNLFSVVNDGR